MKTTRPKITGPLEIRAKDALWSQSVEFLIRSGDSVGTQIIMTTDENPHLETAPSFRIGKAEAQVLMDDLWHCGLRPSEGTGSAGQLASTQRHLEDMRMLVFWHVKNGGNAP